jgi:hypothetical protein
MTRARLATLFATLMTLAACGGSAADPADDPADEPDAPAFDVGAVQANFTAECETPIVVDELFCEQVEIDGMTADGPILIVPTTLAALDGMRERAQVICETIARVHFDGETGEDLGYETVGILDRDGGNAAACSV